MKSLLSILAFLMFAGTTFAGQSITAKIPQAELADGKTTLTVHIEVVKSGTVPPPVTPPPVAPPPVTPGACARVPNVKVVRTTMPAKNFSATYWKVAPREIYAFSFKTASTTKAVGSRASATRVSGSDRGKRVEISRCPGGKPVSTICSSYDAEASGVPYYINVKPGPYTCRLEPGTQYYANVYSKYRTTDSSYNCGASASVATGRCAFLYNQQ